MTGETMSEQEFDIEIPAWMIVVVLIAAVTITWLIVGTPGLECMG